MEGGASVPTNNIPWHLGIYTSSMTEHATASALMFEHTRLTIRVIAFLYQTIREHAAGAEPLHLAIQEQTNSVLDIVVRELIGQTDHWYERMYTIGRQVGGYSRDKASNESNVFVALLKEHISLAYEYANAKFLGNKDEANGYADDLYNTNGSQMVELLSKMTNSPDQVKFARLWKNHLDCTAAYIGAGTSGNDAFFDAKASECLRISVLVGAALDNPMGYRTYLSREVGSKIAEDDSAEEEEKDTTTATTTKKDDAEYW